MRLITLVLLAFLQFDLTHTTVPAFHRCSEYEDEDDAEEEGDAGLENTYYTAKSVKDDDPDEAIRKFEALVDQETEKGDWCAYRQRC